MEKTGLAQPMSACRSSDVKDMMSRIVKQDWQARQLQ